MNKQIRFRVYNKKTKQWIHGPKYEVSLFGEMILLGGFMRSVSILDLNDCEPLEYTGLTDKNGKEIYEGDIVKTIYVNDPVNDIGNIIYHVETGAYRIKTSKHLLPIVTYRFIEDKPQGLLQVADEIIGNIFENPELLK